MRVKAIISYDGSNYHGFQKQNNDITIQGQIEKNNDDSGNDVSCKM